MASPTGSCSSLWILEKLMDIPNQPPGGPIRPGNQYVLCFEDDGETLLVLREPRDHLRWSSKEELSTSVANTPETYTSVGSSQNASTPGDPFHKDRGCSDPATLFLPSPVDSQSSPLDSGTRGSNLLSPRSTQRSSCRQSGSAPELEESSSPHRRQYCDDHERKGSGETPVPSPERDEGRKGSTLPFGRGSKTPVEGEVGKGARHEESKRQSLPEIFGRWAHRLSFRRKSTRKKKKSLQQNGKEASEVDGPKGEVVTDSSDYSLTASSTSEHAEECRQCGGARQSFPLGGCPSCGMACQSFPSVHIQHGAAARMSEWWLDQRSPHLHPKFATLDTVPRGHRPIGTEACRLNPRLAKQLQKKQKQSKRYSLPVIMPKPKTYPRPQSFHGALPTCACQHSSKELQPSVEHHHESRPVSWAAGQPTTMATTRLGDNESLDTLKGTLCANSVTEGTPETRARQASDPSAPSELVLEQPAAVDVSEESISEKLGLCHSGSDWSLSIPDQSPQEGKEHRQLKEGSSVAEVSDRRVAEARDVNQEALTQRATDESVADETASKTRGVVDERRKEFWILPPQELCQKLEQVQQNRRKTGPQDDPSDPPYSLTVSANDRMRDPGIANQGSVPCTGGVHSGGVDPCTSSSDSGTMERTGGLLQETDIDVFTSSTSPSVPDHLQLEKQLDIADRIIGLPRTRGVSEENNNDREGRMTPLDGKYSPRRRLRKASLVLALEDGQLDMDDVAVRSLNIESDIHVIAQLNHLNQQLGELNSNYHRLTWSQGCSPSDSPKPRATKSHSIASTGSAGTSLEAFPYLTTTNLRRSGSESHMSRRLRGPLDIRPSSALGRTNSGFNLTRHLSRERLHSSPEDSPRITPPGSRAKHSPETTPSDRTAISPQTTPNKSEESPQTTPGGSRVQSCPDKGSKGSSPEKKPKIKKTLLRLQGEDEPSDGTSHDCSKLSSSPKPSSPRFVARLKNKLLSPKISLKFPTKANSSNNQRGEGSPSDQDETGVSLRKKSPGGRRGDSIRMTWPFFPPKWNNDDNGDREGEEGQGNQRCLNSRKLGVVQLTGEEMLSVGNTECHDTGSSDSGMEKDWNPKSNDDLITEILQDTEPQPMTEPGLTMSSPQPLYTPPHCYPSSAPMTPYRTPSSGSQEDILEGHEPRQTLPSSAEFRSADNILEGRSSEERPPKPKHRPKRRSRPDLPAEFKAILAELKENTTPRESSEVLMRRKSLTPQRRVMSAYGKLGQAAFEGTPAEKSPTSPLMRLEQRHSCSFDALQLVAESESLEKLPRSRSLTTLNGTIALPPSSISRTLSLPAGLGEEVEQLTCRTRYRKMHVKSRCRLSECYDQETVPAFAEAIWDHVSMDESELVFQVGDVIEITDTTDGNWWWGHIGGREGWLPAACVRLRVGQGETIEDCIERLSQKTPHDVGSKQRSSHKPNKSSMRKISLNLLSNDQVRANVVQEILTTERDYVKLLQDICKGFICQARNKDDLFSRNQLSVIFGNIEDIYAFHQTFLTSLEECVDEQMPHLSEIGQSFLENREKFQLYSDYCNNYPLALSELKCLYKKPRVRDFLEECRTQQDMIKITLDGFLLTPVQKICKYPLQLNELLKYTKASHSDHDCLREAFTTMRETALEINEKKRRMENVQKIADWQKTIADWEGEDLLKKSSKLIYSGDVHRMTKGGKFVLRRLFLFEHQLIICKKDLLRRNGFVFKGRLDMNEYVTRSLDHSKDTPAFSWRLSHHEDESLSLTFASRDKDDRGRWMKAFGEERSLVAHQQETGVKLLHRSYTTPQLKSEEETTKKKILTALIGLGTKKEK